MPNFRLQDNPTDVTSFVVDAKPDMTITFAGPTTDPRYLGSAFQPQATLGLRVVHPIDDRVSYQANEMGEEIHVGQWTLPADVASVGQQSVNETMNAPGIILAENPTFSGNSTHEPGWQHVQINERTATWYDTLRDAAGYPLAAVPDQVWANATNDVMGDSANTEIGLLFPPGDRRVMERSLDIPHRESMMPASIQVPRPWDVELGTWPWAGDKAVLGQPVTAAPLFFQYPIEDGLPSPSGAARAMIPNTPSLDPNPLTWRVPPSPWDTGGDVGYDSTFIDSGTVRNGR